jgi:alkylated DNA repair protein (DNA oxidative demethylase)
MIDPGDDLLAPLRLGGATELAPGAWLLPGFAQPMGATLLSAVTAVSGVSGFRRVMTPGGLPMSVAMTNCGSVGWVSDRRGYRYERADPATGDPWPGMPPSFSALARSAADAAGFAGFEPDACLINRYEPGARMTLHQDRDERDFDAPIVSVSLGLPAVFLLGGDRRADSQRRIPLQHGDVLVLGGASRLKYHGVLPVKPGHHAMTGSVRFNLTFRRAN